MRGGGSGVDGGVEGGLDGGCGKIMILVVVVGG